MLYHRVCKAPKTSLAEEPRQVLDAEADVAGTAPVEENTHQGGEGERRMGGGPSIPWAPWVPLALSRGGCGSR